MIHMCYFSDSLPLWLITGYGTQFSVLYSRTFLFIHSIYTRLHLWTPNSQSLLPPPPPPGNCKSVSRHILKPPQQLYLKVYSQDFFVSWAPNATTVTTTTTLSIKSPSLFFFLCALSKLAGSGLSGLFQKKKRIQLIEKSEMPSSHSKCSVPSDTPQLSNYSLISDTEGLDFYVCIEQHGFLEKKKKTHSKCIHLSSCLPQRNDVINLCLPAAWMCRDCVLFSLPPPAPVPSPVPAANEKHNMHLQNRTDLTEFKCLKWMLVFKVVRILFYDAFFISFIKNFY